MKLAGQTPLDKMGELPRETRDRLKSMWIESVEEYLSLLAAVDRGLSSRALGVPPEGIQGVRRTAAHLIGAPKAEALMRPASGGALGCRLDPDVLAMFEAAGGAALSPPRARAPLGAFPPAVRLMAKLVPVRNQGERGTCVAFATTALREFLAGGRTALSEQFLYWACKQIDGLPDGGTFIHTAMTALGSHGICEGDTWRYNPRQDAGNESQGPPPEQAVARARAYRMADTRTVEPSYVDLYKRMLAGSSDASGMPVVFATLVFDSWYRSSEAHRTGKITMPLPGERPLAGGHAMCVVGYVDDAGAPGGGYLIVRNSWGERWAANSPEAPGHALMPYEYAARYAVEAFTGPTGVALEAPKAARDPLAAYARRLAEPARDLEGRLLSAGTAVLANPLAPADIMEDTEPNRRTFADHGYAWTSATLTRTVLPSTGSLSQETKARLSAAQAARERFLAALDENLTTSVGDVFPEVNLPYRSHLLPWEPRIRAAGPEADLTGQLVARLKRLSGAPADLTWNDQWDELMGRVTGLKVYRIRGASTRADVVVGFVTAVALDAGREPSVADADPRMIQCVRDAYADWRDHAHRRRPPGFTFFSLGCSPAWSEHVRGVADGGSWTLCSAPIADGGWDVRAPPQFAHRLSTRNFLERLRPETRPQRICRVKTAVDELLDAGYEGNVHVEKLAARTGYRRTVVRDALLAMQESGHYRLRRLDDGVLAVDHGAGRSGPRITRATFERTWPLQFILTCLVLIATLGIWLTHDFVMNRHESAFWLLALLPLIYVGRLADRRLGRLLESKE